MLILASESPRRRELVAKLGMSFRCVAPHCSEALTPGLSIEAQIQELAKRKAKSITATENATWILAADTLVALDDQILGKPTTPEIAIQMLQNLSGKTCNVITGFAILHIPSNQYRAECVVTHVHFKSLSEPQVRAYVQTGEPLDKAGAFAIQGLGRDLIRSFDGDFDNVVGLPVNAVKLVLAEMRTDLNCQNP